MSGMSHWAAPLIGLSYRRGACGPDAFDCWGLVRHVFAVRWGIDMPVVAVGDGSADNVAAIKRAAEVSGWAPVADHTAADGDIVLMQGVEGRHVGVMIRADGALRLLHCMEGAGVCTQSLAEAQMAGFMAFTFWRRT
jgi:cell wall-associated NlpC family hydrolase